MKLGHLLSIISDISDRGPLADADVSGIFNDARKVISNSVFIAIKGTVVDGHSFISDAIKSGAICLVVEEKSQIPNDYPGIVIEVSNSREVLDLLASRFYGDAGAKLFCVGVTGTNGKTSVTYMVEAIFNAAGIDMGVIGTVNHHLKDKIWASDMTTPDPLFLQKRLREFLDEGAKAVALEVSSHALDQNRVASMPFNTVIFTNLSRDHLDYHKTMDDYFEAKQKLFTDLLWKTSKKPCYAIINGMDSAGRRMKVAEQAVRWTYGDANCDLEYKIIKMDFSLTRFELKTPQGNITVNLPMSGVHNVQNAVAAIGAGLSAGIDLSLCGSAIEQFCGVPGRLQAIPNDASLHIFVDYAHSPDALENVLVAINKVRKDLGSSAKILTVFGCGGDRDKGKRPLMAQTSLRFSDEVIVTSDNPRTEVPLQIIQEILTGVSGSDKSRVTVLEDRREAIAFAVKKAKPGDVILIAGKGHEDYQIMGTQKIPFSDVLEAEKALKGRI